MKKRIVMILAAALICGVGAGTSYAYLTDKDAEQNVFQVSDTEITIEEQFTPVSELIPGMVINKAPRVVSQATIPCYVRMRVCFSEEEAQKQCLPLVINDGWSKQEDGFFYWKEPLEPGEMTGTLFDQVVVRADLVPEELEKFDIQVYAEAVQSQGLEPMEAWKTME